MRNGYTYKILNMEREPKTFSLRLDGLRGAQLRVIGHVDEWAGSANLPVKADAVGSFRVLVRAEPQALEGKSTHLTFLLTDETTGRTYSHATVFAGPGK